MGEFSPEPSITGPLPEQLNTNNFLNPPSDEQLRTHFEEKFGSHIKGSLNRTEQDGTKVETRTYEFIFDPTDPSERQYYLVDFGLRAAQAGYQQALGPVVLPGAGFTGPDRGNRPLTAAYFFLEKPQSK